MNGEDWTEPAEPIATVGGLARGWQGMRLSPTDFRRLATRVGCFEALLEDVRVVEFLEGWDAPGQDRAEIDALYDPGAEAQLIDAVDRFAQHIGLPTRWLVEEFVRERARRLRARLAGYPVGSFTAPQLAEMLDEARDGVDTSPSVVNIRAEVRRHQREGDGAFLARVDAELNRAMLRSGYYRLASHAADFPDDRPQPRAHSLSEERARNAGRAYYLARLRSPALKGAKLRSELGGLDAPTVSKMIAEAEPRLEDALPR